MHCSLRHPALSLFSCTPVPLWSGMWGVEKGGREIQIWPPLGCIAQLQLSAAMHHGSCSGEPMGALETWAKFAAAACCLPLVLAQHTQLAQKWDGPRGWGGTKGWGDAPIAATRARRLPGLFSLAVAAMASGAGADRTGQARAPRSTAEATRPARPSPRDA